MFRLLPLFCLLIQTPLAEFPPEETTAEEYDTSKSNLGVSSSLIIMDRVVVGRCPVHGPLRAGDILGIHNMNRRYCIKCVVEFLDKSVPEVEDVAPEPED